jgi:hypothetical protein
MLLSKRSRVKSPESLNATVPHLRSRAGSGSTGNNVRVHRPAFPWPPVLLFLQAAVRQDAYADGRLCEQKRTLAAFEHLYAFLAPQSAQIVHATMGEKKEKLLRRSAAAG